MDKISISDQLKEVVIKVLKDQMVKQAITSLAISSGWGALVVKYFMEEIFETVALPQINLAFRKINYQVDRIEGNVTFRKLKTAEEEHDQARYDDILDSTLLKL